MPVPASITTQPKSLSTYTIDLSQYGIYVPHVYRNSPAAFLYEHALCFNKGTAIVSTGALAAKSGSKTGRSPLDKRIVESPSTKDDVWWGKVNIPLPREAYLVNKTRAIDYLNTKERLYCVDGYVGWDIRYRLKVRILTYTPYHALFMSNMLIKPQSEEELKLFDPDYVLYNAGKFPANVSVNGMTSATSVDISFDDKEIVILGTEYAGEMKKGLFSIMHYLMPKMGVLSLHSSANIGIDSENVSLFFGLSGTGKTTLSAEGSVRLIGDDEHCWTNNGIFNIEGGCYAKAIGLSQESEPEIYNAIRFGSVLENVVYDPLTREVDYNDVSITQNTRCSYPIEYIPRSVLPCVAKPPTYIIMLTCDAFGVLPPVAKMTVEQAIYHFISGYTAKIPGTEVGVTHPVATFSACFGEPFIVWHPIKYAQMLEERVKKHSVDCYLVNTGWTGGKVGVGKRIALKHSRAIIRAIQNSYLSSLMCKYEQFKIFNFAIPVHVPDVPDSLLNPENNWKYEIQPPNNSNHSRSSSPDPNPNPDTHTFDEALQNLAMRFMVNFEQYKDRAQELCGSGGPVFP